MLITNNYIRKLVWGIGFAIFCALLTFIYSVLSKRRKRTFVVYHGQRRELLSLGDFVVFFIMTTMASIRLNVGSDYYNYYTMFNNVARNAVLTKDDLVGQRGYYLLSYIIKQFTDNKYAIFAVIAIILYAFLFYWLKSELDAEDRLMAFTCYLFLGFFSNSLNILKQCIAMMFVMCFYKALREKHIFKCIIFAISAVLFHYASFFALVIVGIVTIMKIRPSKKMFYLSVAVGVAFAIFLPRIIHLIIRFVPSAAGYEVYIDWRRNNQIRLVLAVVGTAIMYLFLLYNIINKREQIKNLNQARYFEITFLIIGLCINIASVRIWVVQRIALYFYQFIILVLPVMLRTIEPSRRTRVKRIMWFIMFLFLIFLGIFMGENEYYSYNTIFSGDKPIYDVDFNRMFH